MNGTDHFKRTIQAYLDSRAAEDKLFAASYSKPNKNMDDCITYLLHWAKSQCNGGNGIGVTAGEVLSQAVHYFDEDDIDIGKPIPCQVMVCGVELTDEEKAEARQRAIRQYQDERLRRTKRQTHNKLNFHYSEPMKPKTPIQKEVIRLSATLPELTNAQRTYAFHHCFKHYGRRTAKGVITCTECGHAWKSGHSLADTLCGCTCPNCGTALEITDTRKRVFVDNEYFSIITTCKGYQVIRFFFVRSRQKVGQKAEYSIFEVAQRWIAPDGKSETVARLRGFSLLYYDLWNEDSPMEIRRNNQHKVYDIDPICTYPRRRIIPEIKRNGFDGNLHGILPYDFFKAILSDSRAETLLKSGNIEHLRYFLSRPQVLDRCWNSYKIAMRNKYAITDISLWCDLVYLLERLGKDLRNPRFICPPDFKAAHDLYMGKRQVQLERERQQQHREWEAERLERERKRLEEMAKEKDEYIRKKAAFLNLVLTDGLIIVKVLQSVDEFYEEGKAMHHCVYANAYYNNENSLILSARIDERRIETVEVDLRTLKVVQSRGVCNSNTEYHDRIIKLVEDNAEQIRKRMKEAA